VDPYLFLIPVAWSRDVKLCDGCHLPIHAYKGQMLSQGRERSEYYTCEGSTKENCGVPLLRAWFCF
jgi:hypothetical protein